MRSNWLSAAIGGAAICLALAPAAMAGVYTVTSSESNSTIQSVINGLQPGDTLDFAAGTYYDSFHLNCNGTSTAGITIQGLGTAILDGQNGAVNVSGTGGPRALMQFEGSYITVQNLTLQNAANSSGNGAGFRITGAGNDTISGCSIQHNNMGIMSDDTGSGTLVNNVLVTGCNIGFNGSGTFPTSNGPSSGYTHNIYMGGSGSIALIGNYIHDATDGQNVKTRAHFVTLAYNWISSSNEGEVGMVDGYTSAANSNALIVGNTIVSKSNRTGNHAKYILFGSESGQEHNGTAYIYNNTCIAGMSQNVFVQVNPNTASDPTAAVVKNNIFYGSTNLAASSPGSGTLTSGDISGSNNWIKTGAAWPSLDSVLGNVVGSNPDFVNPSASNYQLLVGSACIDAGTSNLTYVDQNGNLESLSVLDSYLLSQGEIARALSGSAMDIGAYEFQQTPEPATLTLLALGGLGLAAARRRRVR